MIFKEGFIHADPHPGNIFVRPKGRSGDCELVILDHGIYTDLTEETRIAYTKLWRGILTQDNEMLKEAAEELGTDFHELFAAMIANRRFDDIMEPSKLNNTKERLGNQNSDEAKAKIKAYALWYQ
jgi:aarF domain-containing kinase